MSLNQLMLDYEKPWLDIRVNEIQVDNSFKIGRANGTVVSNAVTVNGLSGIITDSGVVSPGNRTSITVTNDKCLSSSLVFVSYNAQTSANLAPLVLKVSPSNGQFILSVHNYDTLNATTAAPFYSYLIVNQ